MASVSAAPTATAATKNSAAAAATSLSLSAQAPASGSAAPLAVAVSTKVKPQSTTDPTLGPSIMASDTSATDSAHVDGPDGSPTAGIGPAANRRTTSTATVTDSNNNFSNNNNNNNNNYSNNYGNEARSVIGARGSAAAASSALHDSISSNHSPSASASTSAEQNISYSAERIIGNGSFGVVFEAKVVETGEVVAIKKVLQDKRFKNRELQIMRQLVQDPHTNIVALRHCFYSQGEKPDELYLNLVLEFVPETVYSISRRHHKHNIPLPLLYVKLYLYQLSRALAHIHALGICHRDIKPQNLLVNPKNQQLKLCDFGSAKALVKGEPNVSYICSRYYRAPELIFGSTDYTTAIDIWSEGCVGAELLLGQPLFPGDSGVDQLVEIIKVLGTPTKEEIRSMNSNYIEFKFPQIKGCQWRKIFRNKTPDEAMDFIAATLAYTPSKRLGPLEGCAHAFFDELRDPATVLPNHGGPMPPLFDFTAHELASSPELLDRLMPPHVRAARMSGNDSKLSGR